MNTQKLTIASIHSLILMLILFSVGVGIAAAADPITNGGMVTIDVYNGSISATRDISDQMVEPGSTFMATLTLTALTLNASGDVQAPTLKENLPAGWTVTPVDNGGAIYKPTTTEWVWSTAMSSGETKTVTYMVTVPASATLQDYYITGQVSAYGVDPIEISGDSRVTAVILYGDVNHDEELSIVDVMLALQMAVNSSDIDFAADVDADGVVTSVDALMIWQAIVASTL